MSPLTLSIPSQTQLENFITCIVWMGIEINIEFAEVTLLTMERTLNFHVPSLLFISLNQPWNCHFFSKISACIVNSIDISKLTINFNSSSSLLREEKFIIDLAPLILDRKAK